MKTGQGQANWRSFALLYGAGLAALTIASGLLKLLFTFLS